MKRLGLASLALLTGCVSMGTYGRPITQLELDKLRPGMNRAQVELILGKPGHIQHEQDAERWIYSWISRSESSSHVLHFKDGKLVMPEPDSRRASRPS